jgi:phosphoribosylaminoimidazolecarboxamide formyltransferase / IMP cyclohydrolase
MNGHRQIRKALISVSDKTGIVEFAKELERHGVVIVSTGGTARDLRNAGVSVTDVSEVTGFPEMMDGRVKTLHPKIHGAFLALRDNDSHIASMEEHGIDPIDLVVVNLYPFENTIAKDDVSLEEAIENIDIGGPAMIRSASKNWRDVAVVTDPALYSDVISEMNTNDGALSMETRRRFAVLAYTRTAAYDLAISSYLASQLSEEDLTALESLNPLRNHFFTMDHEESEAEMDDVRTIELAKISDLRYGENPHQSAALYRAGGGGGLTDSEQLLGKEMSYNNYLDSDAAWGLVSDFSERAVAIIKHTNPSGLGIGDTNLAAYRRALSTDPVSAFGGIVAFNRKVDKAVAESVIEVFTEVIIAPEYDEAAIEVFASKKNLRVIRINRPSDSEGVLFRQIDGGFLAQTEDIDSVDADSLKIVTKRKPTEAEVNAMLIAWKVCKHVKSNAIVLADEFQTIGVGAGQMNRVDSVRIAATRAARFELDASKAALASDAFFPFRDNVDEAAALGVKAIIQPGGSLRDEESIAAADEHGIAMAFTGIRHFRH